MDAAAVAGIVALLFVKEAGVPIPIPGDLVVIAAGATAASRGPGAAIVLLAILGAGFAGGAVQFALLRGGVRRRLLSLMARVGIPAARIEALAARLRGRGTVGVAVSRMTPGIRVVSIAASALAAIPAGDLHSRTRARQRGVRERAFRARLRPRRVGGLGARPPSRHAHPGRDRRRGPRRPRGGRLGRAARTSLGRGSPDAGELGGCLLPRLPRGGGLRSRRRRAGPDRIRRLHGAATAHSAAGRTVLAGPERGLDDGCAG